MTENTQTDVTQLTPIQARQAEVNAYQANITNYTNILANLDGNWDNDLIHLKGVEAQEAARKCDMSRLERLAELQLHFQLENLLKTETVEYHKAKRILDSLLSLQ
jgi:hypothetical protein